MLRLDTLRSSLPLCCKPYTPYPSIERAVEALKGLGISQIESNLQRYNWSNLLKIETSYSTRVTYLQELPYSKKIADLSPPFWHTFIPMLRIEFLGKFITFVAICILRAAMIDLQNPPRTSWDASRQLGIMQTAIISGISYGKILLSYFSTPLRGCLAIISCLLLIKPLYSLLSFALGKSLPQQNTARNLSEEAEKGKLRGSAFLGRERELEDLKCALNSNSNVCLSGPSGAGKTALGEALALAIYKGEVDAPLKGKIVILANAAELVGNTYQWDQEAGVSRPPLDALIASMKGKEDNYILFIDEIQGAIGQEGRSSTNLIEVLKSKIDGTAFPRVIIASTHEEYRASLAKNIAFNRRFLKMEVNELSPDITQTLILQEYAHIIEEPAQLSEIMRSFKSLTDRSIAFPSCPLQLFKLVSSSLRTFSNPAALQNLSQKKQELESLRARILTPSEAVPEVSTISELRRSINEIEIALNKQRNSFEELWAIQDKIRALLGECSYLAQTRPADLHNIFIRDRLFIPALEAKYAEAKTTYQTNFGMEFANKASTAKIQEIFEANKDSLMGPSQIWAEDPS